MKLLVQWATTVVALLAAAWLVPGIEVAGPAWLAYGVMAAVLGLVNAFIRPLLKLLTCPLIILTLGLFVLVVNAATLMLASAVTQGLGFSFAVRGFWPALLGGVIVSVVTMALSAVAGEDE